MLLAIVLAVQRLAEIHALSLGFRRLSAVLRRDMLWKALYRLDFRLPPPKPLVESHLEWKGRYRAKLAIQKRWQSGKFKVWALEGHLGVVTSMAKSHDDYGLLLTGSEDCSVRAWRWESPNEAGGEVVLGKHKSAVWSVSMHKNLAISTATDAKLWDLTGAHGSEATTRAFGSMRGNMPVASVRTFNGHRGQVWTQLFDGRTLATGASDGQICVWDIETGARRACIEAHRESVFSLVRPIDGGNKTLGQDSFISVSADSHAALWDMRVSSGKASHRWRAHRDMVFTATWAGEQTFWSGSGDRAISLWDVRKLPAEQERIPVNPAKAVRSIQFAHDDSVWSLGHCDGRLISGGVDKLVKIWRDDGHASPTAVTSSNDPGSGIHSGSAADSIELPGHQGPVFSVAVDQCHVFSGGDDGLVLVWDFHTDRGGTVKDLWETGLAPDMFG